MASFCFPAVPSQLGGSAAPTSTPAATDAIAFRFSPQSTHSEHLTLSSSPDMAQRPEELGRQTEAFLSRHSPPPPQLGAPPPPPAPPVRGRGLAGTDRQRCPGGRGASGGPAALPSPRPGPSGGAAGREGGGGERLRTAPPRAPPAPGPGAAAGPPHRQQAAARARGRPGVLCAHARPLALPGPRTGPPRAGAPAPGVRRAASLCACA